MRLDDLKLLFKSSRFKPTNIKFYMLNLLQKFEVALTWDNKNLLIPSLLPEEHQLMSENPDFLPVNIPIKINRWNFMNFLNENAGGGSTFHRFSQTVVGRFWSPSMSKIEIKEDLNKMKHRPTQPNLVSLASEEANDETSSVIVQNLSNGLIMRLYLMTYIPAGFWARILTQLLSNDQIPSYLARLFNIVSSVADEKQQNQEIFTAIRKQLSKPEWRLWQTGIEARAGQQGQLLLFSFKEYIPTANAGTVDYSNLRFSTKLQSSIKSENDNQWTELDPGKDYSLLELCLPTAEVRMNLVDENITVYLSPNIQMVSRILATVVEIIDTLLEDWYPSLGTRFMHTCEGKMLVSRIIPCPQCYASFAAMEKANQKAANFYCFSVEECILNASNWTKPSCERHGEIDLQIACPDIMFLDVDLIQKEQLKKGKMIGRGAFGFVFKANLRLKTKSLPSYQRLMGRGGIEVAMKMLQPSDPGYSARMTSLNAYKASLEKWQRDPLQYACRAYVAARQESTLLSSLQKHIHIISLIGICPHPLALVVELAPLGALDLHLNNYKCSHSRLHITTLQTTSLQVAKALEYLHEKRIVYRDLKSENVLVWQFPPPNSNLLTVHVKLGDYGISRSAFPGGGGIKGFGGTECFMAPEILQYNGEEEYTERVDCFSFSMFLYELITLRRPFENEEQVKELILDSARPRITVKETQIATNVLDLMVAGWNQQPIERPSASQIVSIISAPEFSHLLDVVELQQQEKVVAFQPIAVDASSDDADFEEPEMDLWLSNDDGTISILSVNNFECIGVKKLTLDEISFVTAMCLVEETIWLGECNGEIRIFCHKSLCQLDKFNIRLSPTTSSNKLFPITEIRYLEELGVVMLGCQEPAVVQFCAHPSTGWDQQQVLASVQCAQISLRSHSFIDLNNELWLGESACQIETMVINKRVDSKCTSLTISHHQLFVHENQDGDIKTVEFISDSKEPKLLFSCLRPGTEIFKWDIKAKKIIGKMDCSKIVPCSETINSLVIEDEERRDNFLTVLPDLTSIRLVNSYDSPELYIGSNTGVIIMADANQFSPIAAFRPNCAKIDHIIPLSIAISSIGDVKYYSSSCSQRNSQLLPSTKDSKSVKQDIDIKRVYNRHQWRPSSHLITIGTGYRPLIQRFHDSTKQRSETDAETNKNGLFVFLWSKTEDWLLI